MLVDVDDEVVDHIVSTAIRESYDLLKKDKKTVFFSFDKAEEKAMRQHYREAFALVHNWFTTTDLHIKG